MINTGVYGLGTADQVLNATNYARSLKAFSYLSEALRRVQIQAFLETHSVDAYESELAVYKTLQEFLIEGSYGESQVLVNDLPITTHRLLQDFQLFLERKCEESPLFKYWNNFLIMQQLVLNLLRADRTGDWKLHVESMKHIQPLYFILDRVNYIRASGEYLQDIIDLENTHPEVYQEFLKGNFTVKQTNRPFTSIATDQALETTANRSKKNSSGIIGSTRRKEYVTRWELIHPEELQTFNLFRGITQPKNDNFEFKFHHESSPAYTKQSEELIQKIIKFFRDRSSPFSSGTQPLRNIHTQELVAQTTSDSLTNLFEKGVEGYRQFFQERFVERKKDISDPIKKNNIPKFIPLEKPKQKSSAKTNTKDLKYAQRMIDLAKQRGFELETLFSYELMPQNQLFDESDNLKYEANPAALLSELKKNTICTNVDAIPTCLLIDVVAVCHTIQWKQLKSFGDLLNAFIIKTSHYLSANENVSRVDSIFTPLSEKVPHFVKKIVL